QRGGIPGSVSIPLSELRPELLSGRTWWPRLVVVGRDGDDPSVAQAVAQIRRWRGLDEQEKAQPLQILEGGFAAWVAAGGRPDGERALADAGRLGRFEDPEIVDRAEFDAAWSAGGAGKLLLDVRSGMKAEPPFVKNIPLEQLAARLAELPRDRELLVYCASGRRAPVAREILERNGFRARYLKDDGPVP
ncbi:MAG TPA: rhodanese-like domain-containing protein, partial [Anaeromyxobacteraceae bacterium]|nr:rhodanese-like domain-containing protein [Anaeromyxobacteraceae bacterium]